MPQQVINLGATGSGAGGDSARTAFEKAIANFNELYPAALPSTTAEKTAARAMFGLGTAATRDVQTGVSDTTVPALLANGAHGLGAYAVSLSNTGQTTLDAIAHTSFVRLLSAQATDGTAGAPPGSVGGVCMTIGYGTTNARQTYWNITGANRSWTRFMSAGVWSAWAPEFNTNNILGTVSQSGGVPTGAIIERGSNANGEYVKWADGTMECWAYVTLSEAIATAEGAGFYTTSSYLLWTYPAGFIGQPSAGGWLRYGLTIAGGIHVFTAGSGSLAYVPWASRSITAAASKFAVLYVKGRWY